MVDATMPQPDAVDDAGAGATPKASVIQQWIEKLKAGSKEKPKLILYILLAVIIILATGTIMFWGFIFALRAMFTGDPNNPNGGSGFCQDAFDRSKLTLYEATKGQADPGPDWAMGNEGKQYAINTLGIPESVMKQSKKSEVEDMIRAEIVSQFNDLGNEHRSSVEQAQRAILSYQEHESSAFQLFDSNGRPSYSSGVTLNILSLTKDKFTGGGKNKRAAASYDIKYAIYLGVKEHMDTFANEAKGEGVDRWRYTIGRVFLPADPNCYWNGGRDVCRHTVAQQAWDRYANEVAYVCNAIFGTVDVKNLASWYYNQGQAPWGPKKGQCDAGWSKPHNDYRNKGCAITSAAMIARYYGKNIDPYQMGTEMCRGGTMRLQIDRVARLIGKSYQKKKNPSQSDLQSLLSRGPVLAQGKGAFGASWEHWLVIVGISGDKLITNDPSAYRGSAGKQWPVSDIPQIEDIYYFY